MSTLVGAVAKAMAADKHMLLSGDDWLEIVKVAVSEASANPARLFGKDFNSGQLELAADVLKLVLKTIPDQLPTTASPVILKGETLREATTLLLRYFAGAPGHAKDYAPVMQVLLDQATELVTTNAGLYGSKEWLRLVRVLSAKLLAGKLDTTLDKIKSGELKLLASKAAVDALLGEVV
jgi:hypothetical protein